MGYLFNYLILKIMTYENDYNKSFLLRMYAGNVGSIPYLPVEVIELDH
jgi:hypothetical protein